MPRSLGLHLAASLLRAARKLGDGKLTLRATPSGAWGSWNEDASNGTKYQLEVLDTAVPGLEELPSSFPLDRASLSALIKASFRRHRDSVVELSKGYSTLDQGFAALRAISEQLYLEQCSSSNNSQDGVLVEVTSSWLGVEPMPTGQLKNLFSYRVRVTNARDSSIQVLGRGWDIVDSAGELAGHISVNPENAVVGQQPVVPPGCTFEYTSGVPLSTSSGLMRGRLAVAELRALRPWRQGEDWFEVPIAPFQLKALTQGGSGG